MNMQRFQIVSELDNPEITNSDNLKVQTIIKSHFGSTLNFLQAMKKDQLSLFSFIKTLIISPISQDLAF
jgi:hypothetical protein